MADTPSASGAATPAAPPVPVPLPRNGPPPAPEPFATLPPPAPPGPDAAPIENQKPKIKNPRTRRGKIARLPKALRDQVNQMLLDGVPLAKIIAQLGPSAPSLNHVNLVNWKAGGYRDWLKEQLLLDQCRARYELTLDLANQSPGIDSFQVTHKIAAAQICEALADVGPDALRQSLAASPLNFFRMLNALARLTNGGLKCERHLADHAGRQAQPQPQNQPPPKKGLTPETIRELKDKLNLM